MNDKAFKVSDKTLAVAEVLEDGIIDHIRYFRDRGESDAMIRERIVRGWQETMVDPRMTASEWEKERMMRAVHINLEKLLGEDDDS